ncbi:hypothetical protein CSHISOI_07802 [Colletotrichum shisoi]|uniref:Uncharacterized protein n=1 Tax=Colletotrichum shisoi TaxID=2078593 RepID=A0A5Q4BM81_9PEZI|nr:hypothetical protein CSHISOI_07802 [Colletotrichum shisoi]
MLLGNINRILIFLALVCLCTSDQEDRIVIGYRVVAKAEARLINQRNRPFRDPARDSRAASQIGNGVYLANKPGGWQGIRRTTNHHCVFKADKNKFNNAAKAWVPSDHWNSGEESIARYIQGFGLNPDATVRISYIVGYGQALQMLLPTTMVNADTLDLFAICFSSKAKLMAYEKDIVDWTEWDLYGEPGVPG